MIIYSVVLRKGGKVVIQEDIAFAPGVSFSNQLRGILERLRQETGSLLSDEDVLMSIDRKVSNA